MFQFLGVKPREIANLVRPRCSPTRAAAGRASRRGSAPPLEELRRLVETRDSMGRAPHDGYPPWPASPRSGREGCVATILARVLLTYLLSSALGYERTLEHQ